MLNLVWFIILTPFNLLCWCTSIHARKMPKQPSITAWFGPTLRTGSGEKRVNLVYESVCVCVYYLLRVFLEMAAGLVVFMSISRSCFCSFFSGFWFQVSWKPWVRFTLDLTTAVRTGLESLSRWTRARFVGRCLFSPDLCGQRCWKDDRRRHKYLMSILLDKLFPKDQDTFYQGTCTT